MNNVFTVMGEKVYAEVAKYQDGGAKAIRLVIAEGREQGYPFCTVTVNVSDINLNEGEVLVKTWSENTPVYKELVEQGFLIPTGMGVTCGHAIAMVCKTNFPE